MAEVEGVRVACLPVTKLPATLEGSPADCGTRIADLRVGAIMILLVELAGRPPVGKKNLRLAHQMKLRSNNSAIILHVSIKN